jgi:hypothetical protein
MEMIRIPKSWGVRREPRTPIEQRKNIITLGLSYDEQFDWDILFADALKLGNNRTLLIGAPLYELKKEIKFANGNHQFLDLDKVTLTLVETDDDIITLVNEKENIDITVNDLSSDFEDIGCIMTMQKNEPIHWIEDWIRYYNLEHNIKGFVIYDNNSDDYTVSELRDKLSNIDLDVIVHVVDWCMPHGPNTPSWDSDFARYVMFEHFKYKYAWCSRYAINQDIDELLMIRDGNIEDLISFINQNNLTSIIYGNRNIEPYNEKLEISAHQLQVCDRRFKDYYYYSEYNNTNNTKVGKRLIDKWIVIPEKSMEFQWRNHDFYGDHRSARFDVNSGIYFAHFYAMQSKNKNKHPSFYNRNQQLVDMNNLKIDNIVRSKLKKIYG